MIPTRIFQLSCSKIQKKYNVLHQHGWSYISIDWKKNKNICMYVNVEYIHTFKILLKQHLRRNQGPAQQWPFLSREEFGVWKREKYGWIFFLGVYSKSNYFLGPLGPQNWGKAPGGPCCTTESGPTSVQLRSFVSLVRALLSAKREMLARVSATCVFCAEEVGSLA